LLVHLLQLLPVFLRRRASRPPDAVLHALGHPVKLGLTLRGRPLREKLDAVVQRQSQHAMGLHHVSLGRVEFVGDRGDSGTPPVEALHGQGKLQGHRLVGHGAMIAGARPTARPDARQRDPSREAQCARCVVTRRVADAIGSKP